MRFVNQYSNNRTSTTFQSLKIPIQRTVYFLFHTFYLTTRFMITTFHQNITDGYVCA